MFDTSLKYRSISLLLLLAYLPSLLLCAAAETTASNSNADPDAACAKCHAAIYSSYRQTPMARASGRAAGGLLAGEFTHAISGVHYRLFLREGRAWLAYDRPNAAPGEALKGEQELLYFVGSGTRGRTYLFQNDGFWFESPVNWYSKQKVWDMNPKSLDAREMPFTLQVDASCLHCHASAVQSSLPGARNHFAGPPFLYGGVTCESCHGDPSAHLASGGKGAILNPAKLSPTRRDSVCLQCHLEGETVVNRLGRSLANFVPGEELSDHATYYVHSGELGANGRATSQWEALLQSECKRKSGDRLTCTTCHDPHSSVSPEQRVAYFRGKCLTCHGEASFVSKHHPDQPDCVACHMPREASKDVAHEQLTDHRIQRRPTERMPEPSPRLDELTAVGGVATNDRDLGLAYAALAERGNQEAGRKAMLLLERAERNSSQPDPDLHTALGFLQQISGNAQGAVSEYRAALRADPLDSVAAGNLALLEARMGRAQDAIPLWKSVSQNDPAQIAASLNLAIVQCAIGQPEAATQALTRLLEFSPDDHKARQMLNAMANGTQHCGQ